MDHIPYVIRIVNTVLYSNTFIIEVSSDGVVVIDPGNPDVTELVNWLQQNNKEIAAVLLTHEHADHSSGINNLYSFQPFDLICTKSCYAGISNSKQNLSLYLSEMEAFEVDMPAKVLNDGDAITIGNLVFRFMETPGHSPGSTCIFANNMVFTGDTLLGDIKTPVNFPYSSKKDYFISLEKLLRAIQPDSDIFPGHGDSFRSNICR